MKTLQLNSFSPEDTIGFAEIIGKNIKGGEVIELISDLGGGKTTFVRGLVKGMGSLGAVRSPSFALQHEYKAGKLTLHHLDFYRLDDPGIMKEMLEEVMQDKNRVIVVEWGDIVRRVLPADRLKVEIDTVLIDEREIVLNFPDELEYLTINLTS